jgi:hypothetical protein
MRTGLLHCPCGHDLHDCKPCNGAAKTGGLIVPMAKLRGFYATCPLAKKKKIEMEQQKEAL